MSNDEYDWLRNKHDFFRKHQGKILILRQKILDVAIVKLFIMKLSKISILPCVFAIYSLNSK